MHIYLAQSLADLAMYCWSFLGLLLKKRFNVNPIIAKEKGEILILTWAGLRGGISIALALSLPESDIKPIKPIILTATYAVVVFSILIQGLTIESLIKRYHND